MGLTVQRIQAILAGVVLLVGLAIGVSTLTRGLWLDEFITHVTTARGITPQQFLAAMASEQHPLGHYGLAYLAQAVGVTDYVALRALNGLGVMLALFALWYAYRRGAISLAATCVAVVLYASSPIFLNYFAEFRAYSLLFSSSLALSLAWLVMMQRDSSAQDRRNDLIVYFVSLALLANFHYFGTIFGGLMTIALLGDLALRREWRQAAIISVVSAIAAAPAIVLFIIQADVTLQPGNMSHLNASFTGGLRDAAALVKDATARNLIAVACSVVALLTLAENRKSWGETRKLLLLSIVTAGFLVLIVALNAFKPIINPRYLIACAGGLVVTLALLCTRPGLPAWSPIVIALFALALQANAFRQQTYNTDGWRASARIIADQMKACPGTDVYAAMMVDRTRSDHSVPYWREGYRHYAQEMKFTYKEAYRGDTIDADDDCPSLIWLEHNYRNEGLPVEQLLAELKMTAVGDTSVVYVGSGAVVTIH